MQYTEKQAADRGLIDARALTPLVRKRLDEMTQADGDYQAVDGLAEVLRMDPDYVRKIAGGRQRWINFDIADRMVLELAGPLGWHMVPDLAVIWERFDMAPLDFMRPTSPEVVDEFTEISGVLSTGHVAALFDVSRSAVQRRKRQLAAA